ncbi:ASKHA domain-containing protein [Thermosulfuriphilus sp.]
MSNTERSLQNVSSYPNKAVDPLVKRVKLRLPKPNLEDNRSAEARLRAALKEPLEAIPEIPLPVLRELPYLLRQGSYEIVVDCLFKERWQVVKVSRSPEVPPLGLAIDLGSTTIVFYLLDLAKGTVIAHRSGLNPQVDYGEDILTRLHTASRPQGLKRLQELTLSFLNRELKVLVEEKGWGPESIYVVAVAGNTTMIHFLLGLDPSQIFREPYLPAANYFDFLSPSEVGLDIYPLGGIYIFPNIGSYFGGDLIAGILASRMHRSSSISLLVDVGTNAEVVLGNKDFLVACAGAAGPALEGGILTCGLRARKGAIERVRIDPQSLHLTYEVIGNAPPEGLCGSGIIDLLAQMFIAGLVDQRGRLLQDKDPERMIQIDGEPAYLVAPPEETAHGKKIFITEADIKNLIRSKGAMYTILTVICQSVGISFEEIENFYIAGAFGNYIDPAAAVTIGMLPDIPLSRFKALGNAAGAGAVYLLLNREGLAEVKDILKKLTYLEMNVRGEFMQLLTGALFLPHTDPGLFPSVQAKLSGLNGD